jgi:E3 ubiquitin-protein ligase NRDP1
MCGGLSNSDETEKAIQTVRWLSTLKPARVRRWGGMISTPDAILQAIIRRALNDSGCPIHLLNELMVNAHERRWPSGLSTLETRQLNRRRYEQYVTKRVPGKQAIVIMALENEHMEESMIVSPGLVMIFAHGVDL